MIAMRKLLPFLLLTAIVPVFGQAPTPPQLAETGKAEFLDQKFWSDLGRPTEGTRGFSLYTRNMQPKSDTRFELWVKIVPNNALAFNRRYSLPRESAYVVQYATIDCAGRSVQLEKTSAYSSSNGFVDARSSDLVKNESRTRVKPGSVSDTIFQYICLKLPS